MNNIETINVISIDCDQIVRQVVSFDKGDEEQAESVFIERVTKYANNYNATISNNTSRLLEAVESGFAIMSDGASFWMMESELDQKKVNSIK